MREFLLFKRIFIIFLAKRKKEKFQFFIYSEFFRLDTWNIYIYIYFNFTDLYVYISWLELYRARLSGQNGARLTGSDVRA